MKLLLWLPMLWSSHLDYCNPLFRGLSALDLRKLQCVQNSLARIVATPRSIHTSLQLEKHYIGCQLSTVLSLRLPCLYISFLHSGNPKYFEPFLIPRHSAYNTRRSQSDGIFLEVPHFASVFKSRKHF